MAFIKLEGATVIERKKASTPELCFYELTGMPMRHGKYSRAGRDERRAAVGRAFPDLDLIEKEGRTQGLPVEDIFDAAAACCPRGACYGPGSQPP